MLDENSYWARWHTRANNYLGLSQRMLDLEWVDNQIKKGYLQSGFREVIERLVPVLESVYPGRWDIQYDTKMEIMNVTNTYRAVHFHDIHNSRYMDIHGCEDSLNEYIYTNSLRYQNYCEGVYKEMCQVVYDVPKKLNIDSVYIVIHFPEVTITNSKGHSMIIKDVFTKTKLYQNGEISPALYGARSTLTLAEFATSYCHSHLSSVAWNRLNNSSVSRCYYQNFCLGTSDLKTFAHMYNAHKNIADFESYLLMLRTIVSWESLEGGPHVKMIDTIQKSLEIPNVSEEQKITVLKRIIANIYYIDDCDIDWVFSDGKYSIVDNEKFEVLLRKGYYNRPGWPISLYKDDNGNYFNHTTVTQESITPRHIDFIPFRGQKFNLKVEGELKIVGNHQWYINPKIKQYVKQKLESVRAKIETKNYSLNWLNQVSDNSRVS